MEFELSGAKDLLDKVSLVTFQCKLAEDVAFRDCSPKPFSVEKLEDTKSYNLTVIANPTDNATKENLSSEELVVNFAVDLPGGASVDPAIVYGGTEQTVVCRRRLQPFDVVTCDFVSRQRNDPHMFSLFSECI